MGDIDPLDAIIQEEERACAERIYKRVRPILVNEFRRAVRYCPSLKRVRFGNGTFLLDFAEGSILGDGYYQRQLPKACQRLNNLCHTIAYDYPIDDLTSEDL